MLGKEDRALSTAGWAQVESLAREGTEVIMAAVGIRAADTSHALEIVATGTKPLAELPDALKAIPTVGGSVLLIVTVAEIGEMPFEDFVELIATTRNVLVPRRGRDRGCRAHIDIYRRNELLASDRGRGHRPPHNMAHPPDAFSELSLLRGRR
jgi:hypothetical protein